MATTLDIADDVFFAAQAIAEEQKRSLGEVISDLARRSLLDSPDLMTRNGVPLLPICPGSSPVTLEIVNALREDLD